MIGLSPGVQPWRGPPSNYSRPSEASREMEDFRSCLPCRGVHWSISGTKLALGNAVKHSEKMRGGSSF